MVNVAQNRAVHLARRDAHYRLFVRLIDKSAGISSVAWRRGRIQRLLSHIREAYEEALYALRGHRSSSRAERYFVKYLDLMYDAARAAQVMVEHEALLKEDKSFLNQFLGAPPELLSEFEEGHRTMVEGVIGGMNEIIALALKPYKELRADNMGALSPGDRERYRSAYKVVINRKH